MANENKTDLSKTSVTADETGIANAVNVIFIRKNPETGVPQMAIHKRINPNKAGYNQWAIPGGTQKQGESLEQTAIREMIEEVGVNPKHFVFNNMFQVISEHMKADGSVKVNHFNHFAFVCTDWEGEFINNEPHKHTDLEWCDVDKLPIDDFFISKGNIINFVKGAFYSEEANHFERLQKEPQKTL